MALIRSDLALLPPEPMRECLLLRIEDAAERNTAWYLQQWNRGLDPPCCASCAGLRYVSRWESQIDTIPEIRKAGYCACGPAVAMSIGNHRAKLIRGGATWEEARQRYFADLLGSGRSLHAVMVTPDGVEDVTEEMGR